jgi:hypothetical protein
MRRRRRALGLVAPLDHSVDPERDLKSIYAYLRSVPPVVNHVADAQPADATAVASTAGGWRCSSALAGGL